MTDFLLHKRLWRVTQTGNVTNERVAGIIPSGNPRSIPRIVTDCAFLLDIETETAIQLTRVAIYGAERTDQAAATIRFPPAGSAAEALVEWTGAPVLAAGQGNMRVPTQLSQSGSALRYRLTALPRYLLLEYSTAGAGGGANLVFRVAILGRGPIERYQHIGGVGV